MDNRGGNLRNDIVASAYSESAAVQAIHNIQPKPPMLATLSTEHRWLNRLVGDWTYEIDAPPVPGKPTTRNGGTEHVRSLDGMWIVCEGQGATPDGGTATTLMTLGYDDARARCVGSFVGTMMTTLWVYDGTLDVASNTLTLFCDGPSFVTEGAVGKYMDITHLESDDHRMFTSHYQNGTGEWVPFMTTRYRRTKL